MGIIISTIVYAVGSGLTEVLVSPIVESCPFEHKEAAMSLLHSFYCWGSVGVILLSTVFFSVFGIGNWKWLACIWAIIPLYNMFNFITCPIEHPAEDGQGMSIGNLLKTPVFIISILLMICAGASELSMAQWASAFAESALDLSKAMGDIAGPCLFAVTMGISRSLYGKYGDRLDLIKFMIGSGMLCLICYLVASLSDIPMLRWNYVAWNHKHLFGENALRRHSNVCPSCHGRRPWRCNRSGYRRKHFTKCRR